MNSPHLAHRHPKVWSRLCVAACLVACQASLDLDGYSFGSSDAPQAGQGGQGGRGGTDVGDSGAGAGSQTGGMSGSPTEGDGGASLANGAGCGSDGECASARCVDGVCCAADACGACESCAVAGQEGVCSALPIGTDPDDECQPGVCGAARACVVTVSSASFGGTGEQSITAIDVDAGGNLFIAGTFYGQLVIGDETLTNAETTSDVFVAKLDPAGAPLWAKSFPGPVGQVVAGLDVGAFGEVALAGNYLGSVSFGGPTLNSNGGDLYGLGDIWVAKLDSDGNHVFSAGFGAPSADEGATDVAVDPSGAVIIVGGARGSVDFGGGALDPGASSGIFVAKLDAAGAHVWSRMYGRPESDEMAYAVAAMSTGDVVVGGSFDGANLQFPPGTLHTAVDGTDAFIVKLSSAGDVVWSDTLGGTSSQYVLELAVDGADNVLIGGQFFGDIDLGMAPLTSVDGTDAFVAVRSSAGIPLWQRQLGGPSIQTLGAVAADAAGRVMAAGSFRGSADLGDGERFATGSGDDVYLAAFAPNGDFVYASHHGDPNDQVPNALAARVGQFIVAGEMQGTMDLGAGPLTSQGDRDAFIGVVSP